MSKPAGEKKTIKVKDDTGFVHEVVIDPGNMDFNETTLNRFSTEVASWFDYFARRFEDAEREAKVLEDDYETAYSQAYAEYKAEGNTEKRAEALAKLEPKVREARQAVIEAEYRAGLLRQHLRSWEKAERAAQNMGHNLRREMSMTPRGSAPGDYTTPLPASNPVNEIERIVHPGYTANPADLFDDFIGGTR